MEPACRPDVVKLPLPPGVKAGTVVGRGGHNVRWLHFHSGGAHITVSDTGITIRAKESRVRERAQLLISRQLQAAEKLGLAHDDSPWPPRLHCILLEAAFGTDPRVSFRLRQDEIAGAVGSIKDKLYELVSVPRGCGGDATERAGGSPGGGAGPTPNRDQDEVRDQDLRAPDWDRRSSSGGDYPVEGAARFHAASATAATWAGAKPTRCGGGDWALLACAGRALAAGAHKAACCEPSYDVIKIRFKLGKSLFRNPGPRAGRAELSVADLEGASGGRGAYQSVFSNFVPASAVPRITSWLTGSVGFSLVDTKTSATLHVINQELNVHYSISLSMDRGDDSTASLRKLKAGGSKSHSVTLMAAPEQMDLRLKLIAQFREHPSLAYDTDAYSTARRVAAAVRTEGFEGFTRSKRGLPRNRHLEYARRKTKFVYEGCFPMQQQQQGGGGCGQRLRVSVTQVQDDKGTHYEISGCLPDVDAALRQTLPSPQQTHAKAAPAPAAEPPVCFVPEWRRGRSSGGGSSTAAAGGDCRLYDSASSSPARAPVRGTKPSPPPSPTPSFISTSSSSPISAAADAEGQWAVAALARLSEFVVQLNGHLAAATTARPAGGEAESKEP